MSRSKPALDALLARIGLRGHRGSRALHARLTILFEALSGAPASTAPHTIADLIESLTEYLMPAAEDRIWLTYAVLTGRLPDHATVSRALRVARLDGPRDAIAGAISGCRPSTLSGAARWPTVRVVTDRVVLDLHHTAATDLATGIQRVARESARRWERDHDPLIVGWTTDLRSMRVLDDRETYRTLNGGLPSPNRAPLADDVIVPWRCTYVLPELMIEAPRARAVQGLLRHSGSTGAMIGFDCVPLTSSETTADGMGAGFAMMLSAIAHGNRIATISHAAATEYRGWRAMLAGTGLTGPEVTAIPLPVEAVEPSASAVEQARSLLMPDALPMVLCVGSHEPRKNHLAVLHAAELLWREGQSFSLAFVGGNGWSSERFERRLAELQAAGRMVQSARALSDDMLWAGYRLARCVLFPSLNEGFGLPVAEALASGTPVITSDFGSVREITSRGGALLVDPRDDHAICDALRTMLLDDALHARLASEARRSERRSWDDYARESWEYLVHGRKVPCPMRTEEGRQ